MGTQHHVFEDRHSLEKGDILESSGDAQGRYFMGRKVGDVRTVE